MIFNKTNVSCFYLTMINDENRIWEILENFKISKISYHYKTNIPVYDEDTDEEYYTDGYLIKSTKLKSGDGWRYHIFSKHFGNFNKNINRALVFYSDLIIKNNENRFDLKYLILTQNFFILLINSLEVYLVDTFKSLTKGLKIVPILPRFLRYSRFLALIFSLYSVSRAAKKSLSPINKNVRNMKILPNWKN